MLGNDDAATQYFRRNTETALGDKFKPIFKQSMQKVRLDDYITRKALDGLFLIMAEQEKKIRPHPLQAIGDLAKKVFSALLGK